MSIRALALGLLLAVVLSGCVYRVDVQQGNLLDREDLEQVAVGMTRGEVRFLLGTPMLTHAFSDGNRWDYVFYARAGRSGEVRQEWHAVYFDAAGRVERVERDLPLAL